jgi:hypothetical protein
MKIQLDTVLKTIKVEEDVNLNELFTGLSRIFPNKEWKEYKLLTSAVIYWSDPIVINPWPVINPYPTYPWITWGDTTQPQYEITNGTYSIEISN